MKKNQGITLIALVITIIVLLILAGVAISMLSGENGMLTRASEAKERTEEAQKEEETALKDMEVISDFAIKGTKYIFSNGCLTGLSINENCKCTETVEDVEYNLPDGYSIYNMDGSDIENKESTTVTTGMIIKNNNEKVGIIILFGDISGDAHINMTDRSLCWATIATESTDMAIGFNGNLKGSDFVALDINADGIINWIDVMLLNEAIGTTNKSNNFSVIKQNIKAVNLKGIESCETTRKKYVNEIENEGIKAKFEFQEDGTKGNRTYKYKTVSTDTVENILNSLSNKNTIITRVEGETETKLESTETIQEGDIIKLTEDIRGVTVSVEIAKIGVN